MTNDTTLELPARFWAKVNKNGPDGIHSQTGENLGPCWLWTACKTRLGYGKFGLAKGRTMLAYRLSYEVIAGPVASGLELDHLCRVRGCVNPDHLEPVTHTVNVARGEARDAVVSYLASITHCPFGHPYDPDRRNRAGHRWCSTCKTEKGRTEEAKQKARLRRANKRARYVHNSIDQNGFATDEAPR